MVRAGLAILGICFANAAQAAPKPLTPAERDFRKRVDRSIANALRYLSRQQQANGSWQINRRSSCAATSLAVMAFLAGGHQPGEGNYGRQIENGIKWVLDQQLNSGLFPEGHQQGVMYTHGICVLMLSEVYGNCSKDLNRRCKKAIADGTKVILKAQAVRKWRNDRGGWRYSPTTTTSDLSVTGWQLLALRASRNVGTDVPAVSIDAAVAYVKRCHRRGGFAYTTVQGPSATMTGTGVLALQVCGLAKSREVQSGAKYLLSQRFHANMSWFYYGSYYWSISMFKAGGKYWEHIRKNLFPILLAAQNEDGSWLNNQERRFGTIYCTSLAVLALAVEYRYLPIYQRGDIVGSE